MFIVLDVQVLPASAWHPSQSSGGTGVSAPPSGIVGRGDELGRIDGFLRRAAAGGCSMLVSGEPGVGKTVLLQAAADRAGEAGMLVLRANGIEFEADVPYSGLNQILLGIYDHLPLLPGPLEQALTVALGFGSGPAPDRLIVGNAALALLGHVCREQPLLLVVDDVHWLDRSSAMVLGFVARRLEGHRIGLITATRTGAETFFDPQGLDSYEVQPLDPDASAHLVRAHFPSLPLQVRHRILDEARGNPLALVELPTSLTDWNVERQTLPEILPLSERLQALYVSRIAAMPEETRRLLLIAVFESGGELRILRAAYGSDQGLDHLAPAEQGRLIYVDDATGRFAFRHPLIRSAVAGKSTHEDRRRAHQALAEVLADRPERRAWHLAEAATGPDEQVAALLEASARKILRRGDAIGAVTALTRAADLSADSGARARRLAEAAYVGADISGDTRHAETLLATAKESTPDGSPGSLHAAVATVYLLLNGDGNVETAHRILVNAIETNPHGWDAGDGPLIEALVQLQVLCWYGARPELWEPYHRALSRMTPAPPAILALTARTYPDPVRTAAGALDQAEEILASLVGERDPNRIVRIGHATVYLDRLGDSREAMMRLVRQGWSGGALRRRLGALMYLCLDDYLTGRWAECERLSDEGLAVCREQNFAFFTWYFLYTKALMLAGRGACDEADAMADEITRWAAPRGVRSAEIFAQHPRVLAALGRGDFDAAFRHAAAVSEPGTLAPYVPHATWVMFDLVEAAMRSGRRQEARAHAAAMSTARVAAISSRLAVVQAGTDALVADGDARPYFEAALSVPGSQRWEYDTARIRLAYGEWLRRTRAPSLARTQLQAAYSAFEAMGARPWAGRALAELRAAGQSPTSGDDPVAATTLLTAQEREIAELAAGGLTNRQIADRLFLSPRTVGSHLYRIFPKLGITSRAALRDALSAAVRSPAPRADRGRE